MKKVFKPASLDVFAKTMTTIIFMIMIFAVVTPFFSKDLLWPSLTMAIILLFTILVSLSLRPIKYILNGNELTIVKQFNHKSKIENIEKIEAIKAQGIRTFGVGGLFGYFGWFNGNENWFVTNCSKSVKLSSSNKTFVISPKNPAEFIRIFEAQMADNSKAKEII